MWCLTIVAVVKLPETIPIHFNFKGQADNYGNKIAIFFLPVVATIVYFGLTWLNKYPHVFNYPVKITVANAKAQFQVATRLIRFVKLSILLIFFLIILFTYLTAMGIANGLGIWFLPVVEGLLLVPVAIAITKSLKNKNKTA